MRLIDNYSTNSNIDSRQVVWLGRGGNVRVAGNLGTGGTLTLNHRSWRYGEDTQIATLQVGDNAVTPSFGFLFVRFMVGSAAPDGLTVDLIENPLQIGSGTASGTTGITGDGDDGDGGGGVPAVRLGQSGNAVLGLLIGLVHEEANSNWVFNTTARRDTATLALADLTGQTGGSRLRIILPERFIQPSLVTGSGDGLWNIRVTQGQPAVAEVAATSASFDIHTNAAGTKGIRVTLAPGALGSDVSFSIQRIVSGSTSRNISSGQVIQVFIVTTSTAAEVLGQFYTTAGDTTSGLSQLRVPQVGATPGRGVNIQSVAYFGPVGDVEDGTSVIGGLTISQIAGRTIANNLNVNFVPAQHGTSGTDGTPAVARTPLAASLDLTNRRFDITAVSTDTLNQIVTVLQPIRYPVRYSFNVVDGYSSVSAGHTGDFNEGGLVAATNGSSVLNTATFFGGAVGDHVDVAFAAGTDRQTLQATADETAKTVGLRYASVDTLQTLLDFIHERVIGDVELLCTYIGNTNLASGPESPTFSNRPFTEFYAR